MIDFSEVLAEMSGQECGHCGQLTSAYTQVCETCGCPLEQASDESLAGLQKVSMHESKNLKKVAGAWQGLRQGTLAPDAYLAVVEEVLTLADSALDLYASAYMQHRVTTMEAGPAEVYHSLSAAALEMQAGLEAMLDYANPSQVVEGFKRFEAGLWQVDRAQDLAIDRASALVLAGEA